MDTEKSNQYSIDQAQMEAEFIRSTVGLGATSKEYSAAHSQLINHQTRELLKGRDMFQVFSFAAENLDHIEAKRSSINTAEYKIDQETKKSQDARQRISRLSSDQQLLTSTIDSMQNGSNMLDIKLYNDSLLFGFMDAAQDQVERLQKDSIFEKLRQADEKARNGKSNATQIQLSPDELVFAKKALPITLKSVTDELENLNQTQETRLQTMSAQQNELSLIKEKLSEMIDVQKSTINVLDDLEVANGAPEYPKGGPTKKQHQAYLDRIAWRKKQISEWRNQKPRKELPWGKEIGRKWGFFKQINGNYLLLNKGNEWDDVHATSILTNRVPGITFTVYTEGMMVGSKHISVMYIINNGIVEPTEWESREKFADHLQKRYKEIRAQVS